MMYLPTHPNAFHSAIIAKHLGIYCHISVICWPNSFRSANLNTNGDEEIEDRVPRLNLQTISRTTWHRANDISKASRRQLNDHPIDQDNIGADEEINDGLGNEDADDEDEDTQNKVTGPKQRRSRTSNSDIRSSQLRFYSGTWVDILVAAKNNYRLFINNEDPFPERTAASLEDAQGCLLDAIGKFKQESQCSLDEGKSVQA
jgi:hypothetical protein